MDRHVLRQQRMSLVRAMLWPALVAAWLLACGLNPQPEDPGLTESAGPGNGTGDRHGDAGVSPEDPLSSGGTTGDSWGEQPSGSGGMSSPPPPSSGTGGFTSVGGSPAEGRDGGFMEGRDSGGLDGGATSAQVDGGDAGAALASD